MIALPKYEYEINGNIDEWVDVKMIEEDGGRYYKIEDVDPLLKELEQLREEVKKSKNSRLYYE